MILGGLLNNSRRHLLNAVTMSGVSRDAPIGIQCVQSLSGHLFPRFRINRLRWYQATVLLITFFTYMTYHLTRKPLSVVKSVLHRNCSELDPPPGLDPTDDQWCNWAPFNTPEANTLLGALDSAFLFSYAAAMFVSGMVAERVDLRYFLTIGMLISAICCYLFGLGRTLGIHSISYYILVQAAAGIAQTTGWPGCVATVGHWFPNTKKGLLFGVWNSHTSIGNILGTLMASSYVESDWSLSFMYPALVMGAVAAVVFLALPAEPSVVGVHTDRQSSSRQSHVSEDEEDPSEESQVITADQPANLRPNRHSTNTAPQYDDPTEHTSLLSHTSSPLARSSAGAVSLSRALSIPGVIEFSLSLFFAKLVSYTFLFWLPLYINNSTHLTPAQSGALSTLFDVGGVLGAIAVGVLADCSGCPATVCVCGYAVCAPMLFVYESWGTSSYAINVLLLFVTGALVNGPYALITTAVSAELGTHSSLCGDSRALATVTAIVDGTGSVGAALGPLLAGVVSTGGDWSRVFIMLIACDVLALVLLLRIVKSEIVKIYQERRLRSPRVVRIE